MKRKRVVTALGILVAFLFVGGLAFAGAARRGYGGHGGGARVFGRIARQLDLTDDQRAQMRDVVHKHWLSGLGASADRARVARRDLRGLIQDPAADESAIRAASKSAAAADEELAVERHRTFADAAALLTPEQKDKLKALRQEWSERGDRIFGGIDGALKN
jgi:Spy/CpxP family protein refolding chaperone